MQFYKVPIQLERGTGPCKSSTMDDHIKAISKYLGYLHKWEGVPVQYMSLKLFSNQQLLTTYLTYLWSRSTSTTSLKNQIYKCVRVVEFLVAKDAGGMPTRQRHLQQVCRHLHSLAKAFQKAYPHGKPGRAGAGASGGGGAEPPPMLPSKDEVFTWQQCLKKKALLALLARDAKFDGEGALVMQDWLLSEWLCNNIPAIRLSCIRSLQVPPMYNNEIGYCCQHADCEDPNCLGNRLEVVEDTYCSSQERVSLRPPPPGLQAWAPVWGASPPGAGSMQEEAGPVVGAAVGAGQGPAPMWCVKRGGGKITTITTTEAGGLHTRWDSDDEGDLDDAWAESDEGDDDCTVHCDDDDEPEDWEGLLLGPGPGSIMPDPVQILKVVLPHHKEEKEWGIYALQLELPFDLALTTHLYLRHAYPLLSMMNSEDNNFMLTTSTGGHLALPEQLTNLWAEVQHRHQAPWSSFSPMAFRDIHIMDRVQHLSQLVGTPGGQALVGDATVMQNSVGHIWEKRYHKGASYYIQMARGAVDRMTHWRHRQYESELLRVGREGGQGGDTGPEAGT